MAIQDFLLPALEQLKYPSLSQVFGILAATVSDALISSLLLHNRSGLRLSWECAKIRAVFVLPSAVHHPLPLSPSPCTLPRPHFSALHTALVCLSFNYRETAICGPESASKIWPHGEART